MRRSYTSEERAAARACLDAHRGNLTRAARECGVPANTLRRWAAEARPETEAMPASTEPIAPAGSLALILRETTGYDMLAPEDGADDASSPEGQTPTTTPARDLAAALEERAWAIVEAIDAPAIAGANLAQLVGALKTLVEKAEDLRKTEASPGDAGAARAVRIWIPDNGRS